MATADNDSKAVDDDDVTLHFQRPKEETDCPREIRPIDFGVLQRRLSDDDKTTIDFLRLRDILPNLFWISDRKEPRVLFVCERVSGNNYGPESVSIAIFGVREDSQYSHVQRSTQQGWFRTKGDCN